MSNDSSISAATSGAEPGNGPSPGHGPDSSHTPMKFLVRSWPGGSSFTSPSPSSSRPSGTGGSYDAARRASTPAAFMRRGSPVFFAAGPTGAPGAAGTSSTTNVPVGLFLRIHRISPSPSRSSGPSSPAFPSLSRSTSPPPRENPLPARNPASASGLGAGMTRKPTVASGPSFPSGGGARIRAAKSRAAAVPAASRSPTPPWTSTCGRPGRPIRISRRSRPPALLP